MTGSHILSRWCLHHGSGKDLSLALHQVGLLTYFDQAQTAAATWNIIRHYSGLSEETLRNMERLIDDPSNGMMLEPNLHNAYDKLKIFLEPKPAVSSRRFRCYRVSRFRQQRQKMSTHSRRYPVDHGCTLLISLIQDTMAD